MSTKKTERLTALALLLMSSRIPLTKEQIGAYVGEYDTSDRVAFERQFERDKADLRSLGLAIIADDPSDPDTAAYRADLSSTVVPTLTLSSDEKLLLGMAAALWSDADWGRASRTALTKLEAAGGEAIPEAQAAVGSSVTRSSDIATIIQARQQGQAITFDYLKPQDSVPMRRRVEPWGCVIRGERWFLVGLDQQRQAVRVFRLSRITGPVSSVGRPGAFEVPPDADLEAELNAVLERDPVGSATLAVAPGRAPALRSLAVQVGADANGDDLLELPYREAAWALRVVLGAGDAARVVSPPGLAEEVKRAAEKVAAMHSGPPSAPGEVIETGRERAKSAAPERVARILNLVAWVRSRNGSVPLAEAAAKFEVSPELLAADVELASCTEFGVNHETLEIGVTDDGWIRLFNPQAADRPVSLSGPEALPLLMGLAMLEQFDDVADTEVFAQVRDKVTQASGRAGGLGAIALANVDETDASVIATVRQAIAEGRVLDVTYLSVGHDSIRRVLLHPVEARVASGHRYLFALEDGTEPVYVRLDRVQEATLTGDDSVRVETPVEMVADGHLRPFGTPVTVLLSPSGREFPVNIPCDEVSALAGGGSLVRVSTSRPDWLARAVLAECGAAEVLEPTSVRTLVAELAASAGERQSR